MDQSLTTYVKVTEKLKEGFWFSHNHIHTLFHIHFFVLKIWNVDISRSVIYIYISYMCDIVNVNKCERIFNLKRKTVKNNKTIVLRWRNDRKYIITSILKVIRVFSTPQAQIRLSLERKIPSINDTKSLSFFLLISFEIWS